MPLTAADPADRVAAAGAVAVPAVALLLAHTDMPLLRHYSSAFKFYGAVPGAQLVVRMISTVYNYDYIQDLVGVNLGLHRVWQSVDVLSLGFCS
jgi:hypothetical protein